MLQWLAVGIALVLQNKVPYHTFLDISDSFLEFGIIGASTRDLERGIFEPRVFLVYLAVEVFFLN